MEWHRGPIVEVAESETKSFPSVRSFGILVTMESKEATMSDERQVEGCINCGQLWLAERFVGDELHTRSTVAHVRSSEDDGCCSRGCGYEHIVCSTVGATVPAYVNAYRVERNALYGGPEEGGWYKSLTELVGFCKIDAQIALDQDGQPVLFPMDASEIMHAFDERFDGRVEVSIKMGETEYTPRHWC
jgi:hypothetical protein